MQVSTILIKHNHPDFRKKDSALTPSIKVDEAKMFKADRQHPKTTDKYTQIRAHSMMQMNHESPTWKAKQPLNYNYQKIHRMMLKPHKPGSDYLEGARLSNTFMKGYPKKRHIRHKESGKKSRRSSADPETDKSEAGQTFMKHQLINIGLGGSESRQA